MTDASPARSRSTGLGADWIGLFAGLGLFLWSLGRHFLYMPDDTYITLIYARNLAQHTELAWNLGERSEGYTSFLHVVILGGLIRAGLPPATAAFAIALTAALLLAIVAFRAARLVAPGPETARARGLAVFSLLATPAVAVWTAGGLETVLNAVLMAAGLSCLLRAATDPRTYRSAALAGLCFSLAILTRLDNAPVIAAAGLVALIAGPGALSRRLLLAVLVTGIPAAVAFAQMAVRFAYYDLAFPLPFYAKTGVPITLRLQNGISYFLISLAWLPILFAGTAAALLGIRRGAGFAFALTSAAFAVQILFVLWAGGDHMLAGRLLLAAAFPTAMLLLVSGGHAATRPRLSLAAFAAAASLAAAILQPKSSADPAAVVGEIVAEHIRESWPPGSLVALHTAGSTPYFAPDMVYIDMLGLNDPTIALRSDYPQTGGFQGFPGHAKGDGAYVLSRQPDFIIAGFAEGSPVEEGWFLSDVELASAAEFQRCYRRDTAEIAYDRRRFALGPDKPYPLIFTYYRRTCG
ncbi:hypothetical protein [Frigidibacter sp. SD6-1]|uniref:hypothetical protein n=1 Tax=Frigidibacter sp. SD6-1 TaxID=3032581 RepID=UPI0024DF8901|nr:hypothetical protein [Frigidibacter sp. SD6-1]